MRGTISPYEVLGLSPDASLDDIRSAYRKGALKYHPDNYHHDPAEAEEKFRTLAKAYKTALRWHLPKHENNNTKPYSPSDFARMDTSWYSNRHNNQHTNEWSAIPNAPASRSVPTVNENGIFVLVWALTTALGMAIVFLVGIFTMSSHAHDEMGIADIIASEAAAFAMVTAIFIGTIYGLILTRKTIWYTLQLGARLLPFLPKIRKLKRLPQSVS
ncbi:MAG: J domain-containing protein [bacterium]|nr:J domain-containing protein [bacterium]